MVGIRMSTMEQRFANILWDNEPIRVKNMVALAEAELGWKRSTTNTVLRRLCDNGVFKNENRIVSASITKAEYSLLLAEKVIDDMYKGSLPAFVAAFTGQKKISKEDAEKLMEIVSNYEK